MARSTICITAKEFNGDRLIMSDRKQIKTKANTKMNVAEITYLNDKEEPCDLYIALPKVSTWGPHPQFPYGSCTKAAEDICGYTFSYQNEETNNMFQCIQKKISKNFKKCIIKPVFTKNKNGKETAYLKVKMTGEKISTSFYSDKKCTKSLNGLDIVSKFGELSPMIHLRSIYFGSHGTSDYNCSLQLYIVKAIFQEKQDLIPDFPEIDFTALIGGFGD